MKLEIADFFEKENIEYYKTISYSSCRIMRNDIMERKGFLPKTVILFLIPYYTGDGKNLSRYAISRDYHLFIKEITDRLIDRLRELYPNNSFAGFGDHSPIDERHAALISGLGILGKNGLLINEKYGSYVFVAEVICDVELSHIGTDAHFEIGHCSSCGKCVESCPTGRLSGGEVCLSEVTQRKGELLKSEVDLMRKVDTVWGCDVCQSVCPYNKSPKPTPISFFYKDRIEKFTSQILSDMTDEEFKKRAYSWRKRETIARNLKHIGY